MRPAPPRRTARADAGDDEIARFRHQALALALGQRQQIADLQAERAAVAQQEIQREQHDEEAAERGQHIGHHTARRRREDRQDALHALAEQGRRILRQRHRNPGAQHLPEVLDLIRRRQRRLLHVVDDLWHFARHHRDEQHRRRHDEHGRYQRRDERRAIRTPIRTASSEVHAVEHHREHRRPRERPEKRAQHLKGEVPDEEHQNVEEDPGEAVLGSVRHGPQQLVDGILLNRDRSQATW